MTYSKNFLLDLPNQFCRENHKAHDNKNIRRLLLEKNLNEFFINKFSTRALSYNGIVANLGARFGQKKF